MNLSSVSPQKSAMRRNSFPGLVFLPSAPGNLTAAAAAEDHHDGNSRRTRHSYVSYEDNSVRNCCVTSKLCWWEPSVDESPHTIDFCLDTSLHGLKYIGQPQRHLTERIFWLIAFIVGSVAAAWLISDVWMKYLKNPIIVTFQPFETGIGQIPFPAVTICNMNKVLKSKAEQYMSDAKGPENSTQTIEAKKAVYYLDHVCSSSRSFSKKFNYSSTRGTVDFSILQKIGISDADDEQSDVAGFLQTASQKCMDMLVLCIWQDEVRNCSDLFKPNEATDFGKWYNAKINRHQFLSFPACTFNMVPQTLLHRYINDTRDNAKEVADWAAWDLDKDGLLIPDSAQTEYPRRQHRAGKSSGLSILVDPGLPEYFCTVSDSKGFRLQTHLPIDVPHIQDFGIAIKPNSEVFMSIRPEITMADPSIKNFKMEKRKCYFRGEYKLAYYKYYTVSNCLDECIANRTYEICNCVRFYMPRDNDRALCGPANFSCAEDIRKASLARGIKKDCWFCFPTCTELEYYSETTFTPIQDDFNLWVDDYNVTADWSESNVSIVHIYFGQDSTYARIRTELYGISDLIANTGGLMGLCLGFSGLSLIECMYFFTLRAWCRTRRRRTIWAIIARKFHKFWVKNKSPRKYVQEIKRNDMQMTSGSEAHVKPPVKSNDILSVIQDSKSDFEVFSGNLRRASGHC